ncbi:polyprenyl synthetase family protein [Nocardioides sp.]|uniref:polyprenyl synthetase family protein n=1 Tax=Nocardioides sp. TaxID=35761 RepID=UPI003516E8A8
MGIGDVPWDDQDDRGFRADLERRLAAFLDLQARRLAPLGPDAARLIAEARLAVAGGKRFRATFCRWGHLAVDPTGGDTEALLGACGALELLHASALAHDDLMDASDTRRGRPATHRAFEAEHRAAGHRGDAVDFGAAAAILLGDLLQAWSDEMLRTSGFGWDRVGPALELFDLCRSEVIAGQFLDVSVQARGHADVDTAMTVLRYKSAKYSIERPLHVGAALAGADEAALAALTGYGLPLGEAFQLRDDLLGVFGDPATTGKPAGDDLVEGKRTVLVALALDALRPTDPGAADELDAALGTPLAPEAVERLRGLIRDCGAADAVEARIGGLVGQALTALDGAGLDPRATTALRTMADAVTRRTA